MAMDRNTMTFGFQIVAVKKTITDGEVADWVSKNVKKSEAEKKAHADGMLNYPKADDEAGQSRLKMRKEQGGLIHRDDIRTFIDLIDADEKRL